MYDFVDDALSRRIEGCVMTRVEPRRIVEPESPSEIMSAVARGLQPGEVTVLTTMLDIDDRRGQVVMLLNLGDENRPLGITLDPGRALAIACELVNWSKACVDHLGPPPRST